MSFCSLTPKYLPLVCGSDSPVTKPRVLWDGLPNAQPIKSIGCGPEMTWVEGSDGSLWGCGWNEHGTCGSGGTMNQHHLRCLRPADGKQIIWGVGGAHVMALARES